MPIAPTEIRYADCPAPVTGRALAISPAPATLDFRQTPPSPWNPSLPSAFQGRVGNVHPPRSNAGILAPRYQLLYRFQ
jgi:hypothetical protein